jgi:GT2 family glycosyltransferase
MPESKGQIEFSRTVIAIVATDEQTNIIGCIQRLCRSNDRDFRIIICENSGDEAFDRDVVAVGGLESAIAIPSQAIEIKDNIRAQHFYLGPDQRLLTILNPRENRGYSGGVNTCIAAARDGYAFVWVLNPDTFPAPDALAALVQRQAEGNYGIVGSRIVFKVGGCIQFWGGMRYFSLLGRCRSLGRDEPFASSPNVAQVEEKLDVISGASMFVSKDYIDKIGVMDEDFFVYYEDTEWSLRRGRYRLGYAHDSVVEHLAGATSGSGGPRPKRSRFNVYLTERNRVLIAKKMYPRTWLLFTVVALAQTLEYILRFNSLRAFGIALEGWWAGLSGETGMPGFMVNKEGVAAKKFMQRSA